MGSRSLLAFSALALATLVFTGCTSTDAPPMLEAAPAVDVCAQAAPSGGASDAVTVTGTVGSPASIAMGSPVSIVELQRSIVVEGTGDSIDSTSLIDYGVTVFDAATGQQLLSQGYEPAGTLPLPAVSIGQYLGCAPVGSRLVVTVPASDVDPATIQVFDVLGVHPGVATGPSREAVDAMPTVELTDGGAPIVRIPSAAPPSETEVAVLKKGDGAVVEPGDTVMLHYSGVRWSNGLNFESSWNRGTPTALVTTEVIDGYRLALEGQTVGSQVLVVIPPAAAYGEGEINEDDLTGETLVFVIDILATAPATAVTVTEPTK
jgi:peptidylprolyl isomerase